MFVLMNMFFSKSSTPNLFHFEFDKLTHLIEQKSFTPFIFYTFVREHFIHSFHKAKKENVAVQYHMILINLYAETVI